MEQNFISYKVVGIGPSQFARYMNISEVQSNTGVSAAQHNTEKKQDFPCSDVSVNTFFDNTSTVDPYHDPFMCPTGSCGSSRTEELYKFSEDYDTEQLIVGGMNPDLARQTAREHVEIRKKADQKSEKRDRLGEEGIGPEFILTPDGDIYFPEYNDSLEKMYERQQKSSFDMYHKEEHETVLRAYQKLRDGASQSAHVCHNYNEKGELEIRDVVILTYDHQSGRGEMHVLNISNQGTMHATVESALEAATQRLVGFETVRSDDICVFVRKDNPIDPVSLFQDQHVQPSFSQHRSVYTEKNPEPHRLSTPLPDASFPNRPVFDADRSHDVPFTLPLYLQRLTGRDSEGNSMAVKAEYMEKSVFPDVSIKTEVVKQEKHFFAMKEKEQKTIDKKEAAGIGKSLFIITKTEVAKGSIPVFLDVLTGAPDQSIEIRKFLFNTKKQKEKNVSSETKYKKTKEHFKQQLLQKRIAVFDSEASRQKNVVELKRESKMSAVIYMTREFRKIKKELKRKKIESLPAVIKMKKEKLRKNSLLRRIKTDTVEILFSFAKDRLSNRKKELNSKEPVSFKQRQDRAVRIFTKISLLLRKEFMRSKKYNESRTMELKEKRKEQKNHMRILVLQFVQVFAYLQLLGYIKSKDFHINPDQKKKSDNHNIVKQEQICSSTPWILLAIVRYLVAIREQGKTVVVPKKKKQKVRTRTVAKVIYQRQRDALIQKNVYVL